MERAEPAELVERFDHGSGLQLDVRNMRKGALVCLVRDVATMAAAMDFMG